LTADDRSARPGARRGERRGAPNYVYIESRSALEAFCAEIRDSRALAIDTEFVGEKTFHPRLEIVQIADDRGRIGIVDVPAVGDLAPLAEPIADSRIEKVFHAGTIDLAILERRLGVLPEPIFDTQLAAAMAGLGAQISYKNLVELALKARVGGKQTVSDWSRRPLSRDQLDYSAEDVAHLHALRDRLAERLTQLGRLDWLIEEQRERIAEIKLAEARPEEEQFRQVKEWRKLEGRDLAVLRELTIWRERTARRLDLARRFVMTDAGLIALAQLGPRSVEEMTGLRRVPTGPARKFARDILAAIERGAATPRETWPRKGGEKPPIIPTGLVEVLQALVRCTAEAENIASTMLATSDDLKAIAANLDRLERLDSPVLKGWRRELVGRKIIALIEGHCSVGVEDGQLRFKDTR
jgi:ribonuclease D